MQERHLNRRQYFQEQANTAQEFYMDYLRPFMGFGSTTRVLEIGCGEGGNLLPFAEAGCQVTGIDISQLRINEAQQFFAEAHQRGTFLCKNFMLAEKPKTDAERFDLVLVHDVIEHLEPSYKHDFFNRIKSFVRQDGIVFFGFPAWQNPFGGHQQICTGFASKLPFIHLLPSSFYRGILRLSGASQPTIVELMSIRRSRMSVERFERIASETGYVVMQRTLWLINPHYKQKFHLTPRRQWPLLSRIPYLRNFYTTSAFYLIRSLGGNSACNK